MNHVTLAMTVALLTVSFLDGKPHTVLSPNGEAASTPSNERGRDDARVFGERSGVGDADPQSKCELNLSAPANKRCKGLTRAPILNATVLQRESNANWLLGINANGWRTPRRTERRSSTGGASKPFVTIQAIGDAKSMPLNELNNVPTHGLVVARIAVEPGAADEAGYGLTYSPDYERYYYIVVNGFQNSSPTLDFGTRISEHRVFRIRKASSTTPHAILEEFRAAKPFRWCTMTHGKQQRFEGSRFATCKSAEDVIGLDNQLIIRRAVDRVFPHQSLSIVDAVKRLTQSSRSATPAASATLAERVGAAVQRLVRRSPAGKQAELRRLLTQPAAMEAILSYLDDETISPAWMTCGVGCCTAEF